MNILILDLLPFLVIILGKIKLRILRRSVDPLEERPEAVVAQDVKVRVGVDGGQPVATEPAEVGVTLPAGDLGRGEEVMFGHLWNITLLHPSFFSMGVLQWGHSLALSLR